MLFLMTPDTILRTSDRVALHWLAALPSLRRHVCSLSFVSHKLGLVNPRKLQVYYLQIHVFKAIFTSLNVVYSPFHSLRGIQSVPYMYCSGHRPPTTTAASTDSCRNLMSSGWMTSSAALAFSSSLWRPLLPGMGMSDKESKLADSLSPRVQSQHEQSGCVARIHASATCAGVAPYSEATLLNTSTSARFLGKFSAENRGKNLRASSAGKSSGLLYL